MEETKRIPGHVSIIMDGNGRWAKERGKERFFGHLAGVESVRVVLKEAAAAGVKWLSLYTFSEENWNRPQAEVEYLMDLMVRSLYNELQELDASGVRLMVVGNKERLSDRLKEAINDVESKLSGNTRITLVLLFSYSGKWDIFQAALKLAREAVQNPSMLDEVKQDDFDKYLATNGIPDPDLIIRTSGEQRMSNYLLWQGAYSEFYFTDVLWPDFRKEQLDAALSEYARRDRRYGKVK